VGILRKWFDWILPFFIRICAVETHRAGKRTSLPVHKLCLP
jgi:hypothetical protein